MSRIPDPAKYARRLPSDVRLALLMAYASPDGLRVEAEQQQRARRFSLIDAQTPHLSAFGLKVRAAVRAQRNVL